MLQAAWASPIVIAAIATPASAASPGTPVLSLGAFALDENYAWGNVDFARTGVVDLTQTFDYQGLSSDWEPFYAGLSTDSSGHFGSTLARVVIGGYSQIRVTAFVTGYGSVVSNSVAVSDIWP